MACLLLWSKSVGVIENAFIQVAVMLMGSWFDVYLTDSQQVVKDEIFIM